MQGYLGFEYSVWLQLILVLATGTVVIVGLAGLAGRLIGSALWRRTAWQVATLGLLALLAVELTGTGAALVELCRTTLRTATIEAEAAAVIEPRVASSVREEKPSPVPVELVVPEDLERIGKRESPPAEAAAAEIARSMAMAPDLASPVTFGSDRDAGDPDFSARAVVSPPADLDVAVPEGESPAPPEDIVRTKQVAQPAVIGGDEPTPAAEVAMIAQAELEDAWWLGVIWVLGAVAIVGRIVFSRALLLVFRRRHAVVSDEVLCRRVSVLAWRLGMRRPVCVLQATGLKAPVVFGSLRPTIALPESFADNFDRRQQEAILAHELAHLATGDPAWQLVTDLLCAVLWWHPLAWWLRRCLRAASEATADEASLLVPDGPDVLADCLVVMGRQLTGRQELGWLSIGSLGFRSRLGRRVERLLNLPKRTWRAPRRGRSALVKTSLPASLVIVAVLCTAWVRPQATLREGGTTMNVLSSSWRRSLAAVALVALMSTASGDAVADDSPTGEASPAVARGDLPDGGLIVLQEEGERKERPDAERREGGDRDRPDAERREGERKERPDAERREGGERDRPDAERREGGDRDRPDAERREGGDRDRPEAERREGPERERLAAKLKQEHRELEERAAAIKREMAGLRDGQDAEARELEGALRETRERMEQIERELRGGEGERREGPERERARHLEELKLELGRLHEKAQQIKRELGDRGPDQAPDLHAALREIGGRMEQIERELRGGEGERREGPERERARHLEELKLELGRLHEKAQQIKRELGDRGPDQAPDLHAALREIGGRMEEIERQLRGGERERPGPGPGAPPEELQRRIMHLKAAIENLHAAGLHEPAERLIGEVERLINEHRERFGRPPEGPRPPEGREGPPPREQTGRLVQEMRGELQQLRREMEELRGLVKEMLGRERGERR